MRHQAFLATWLTSHLNYAVDICIVFNRVLGHRYREACCVMKLASAGILILTKIKFLSLRKLGFHSDEDFLYFSQTTELLLKTLSRYQRTVLSAV